MAPQVKRENKEAVGDEDEELFWRNGLFGQSTANSLIIVFMFTWNDFWFKGRGHWNLNWTNFELGLN